MDAYLDKIQDVFSQKPNQSFREFTLKYWLAATLPYWKNPYLAAF